MNSEPVLLVVGLGTALVQAVMQVVIAFGVPLTTTQQAAITALAGVVVAIIARSHVTPVAGLPAGTLDKIANANAAKGAQQ